MDRPNIILINCDDLGYGDLGCYGSEVNKTPILDKLAGDGIRFTDFYMASSVCSPSRGAMMTGCYPSRIGFGSFDGQRVLFPGQGIGLNPNELTISKLLQKAGYATKIIGKWHCGDQKEFLPTRYGFDSYYGLPYSNDMGIQSQTWYPRPSSLLHPPLPLMRDDEVIQEQPDQSGLTERYVEEATRFIRANVKKPFFLYLAHMYVHLPIYAQNRFIRESENGVYGAAVASIDWATGVILAELKRYNLDENTLVIFTSDNGSRLNDGGGSNGPLRGAKGSTWEGGQRVPCIMRWPSRIPPGAVCKELTSALDLLPTFAAIVDETVPQDNTIDGQDIRTLVFAEENAKSPSDSFFYYFQNNLEAVRSGRWKLHTLKGTDEIHELYDLESDMGETENVFGSHPDVVADLTSKLDACRNDIGDEATGEKGRNTRHPGRVDKPVPLTSYDPEHPYLVAMYDIEDQG